MLENPLFKTLTDFSLRMVVFLACLSVLFFAVIGIASVCSSGHKYSPSAGLGPGSSLAPLQPLAVATTGAPAMVPTPIPTVARPTALALTPVQPSATPPQAPPPVLAATAAPPVQQSGTPAAFAGTWRVTDFVTSGNGMGQTYTFDLQLSQAGAQISGSGSGLTLSGRVDGATAYVSYAQPALGYTGSFIWTMSGDGASASGSFTNSSPNQGQSSMTRGSRG
jgi:hypothetical protein